MEFKILSYLLSIAATVKYNTVFQSQNYIEMKLHEKASRILGVMTTCR